MASQNNKHLPWELSSQLVSMMTTEHYTLQMGYAISTSEVNGRSSLFVGTVSSALIALAFVAQISHFGTAFFVFGLVVIPTLFVMGLITFERLLLAAFTLPLALTTSLGVVTFLLSVGLHLRYQWRKWVVLDRNLPVLFPSQPSEEKRLHVKT